MRLGDKLPLFQCALGNGWILWIRAQNNVEALRAALEELDQVPDLDLLRTTVIVTHPHQEHPT
jgi:hypothetical protein